MKFTKIIPESDSHQMGVADQSLKECEKPEHERELLCQITVGDREIESGKGYSLDCVMKDADALLRDRLS